MDPRLIKDRANPNDEASLLYEAVAADHGIKVLVNNRYQLEQRLRKLQANDPMLACLTFRTSPNEEGVLWIVKRPGESDDPSS